MSNDELQKAIDDITNNGDGANEGIISSGNFEPAASGGDEPAMPRVDEDMGGLAKEANKNAEMETFGLPMPPAEGQGFGAAGMPEPKMPDFGMMPEGDAMKTGAVTEATPPSFTPEASIPEVKMEAPAEVVSQPAAMEEVKMPELSEDGPKDPELKEVETAALLELYPLLEKMNVNPREKFDICMKVIEKTGEKGATSAALAAAKEITDEKEKGECLVSLVEVIDKM